MDYAKGLGHFFWTCLDIYGTFFVFSSRERIPLGFIYGTETKV